jgi:hypothetical protein
MFKLRGFQRFVSSSLKVRNDKWSALKSLEDSYKQEEVVRVEKVELLLPPGISEEFHKRNNQLLLHLKQNKKMNIQAFTSVLSKMETAEEQQMMGTTAKEWLKSGRMFSFKATDLLAKELIEQEKHNILFKLLCNRFRFELHPTPETITKVIAYYHERHLKEPDNIQWLDFMYKYFAVLLYYDIPPTLRNYHHLIAAGLYGRSKEGIKRSLMTIKEVEALTWKLLPRTKLALIYHLIQEKELDSALLLLSELEATKLVNLIKTQIMLEMDLVPQAIELTKLLDEKKLTFHKHDMSATVWKSQSVVLEMVKQAAIAKGIDYNPIK